MTELGMKTGIILQLTDIVDSRLNAYKLFRNADIVPTNYMHDNTGNIGELSFEFIKFAVSTSLGVQTLFFKTPTKVLMVARELIVTNLEMDDLLEVSSINLYINIQYYHLTPQNAEVIKRLVEDSMPVKVNVSFIRLLPEDFKNIPGDVGTVIDYYGIQNLSESVTLLGDIENTTLRYIVPKIDTGIILEDFDITEELFSSKLILNFVDPILFKHSILAD